MGLPHEGRDDIGQPASVPPVQAFTRPSRTICEMVEGSQPAAPAPHPFDVWPGSQGREGKTCQQV